MNFKQTLISQRGFSLIELIVVIVLLGILAVSVGSRFVGTGGYAEYSYQSRLISSLRAMQVRAMHDTRSATVANPSGYCFQVNFSLAPAAFGPPTLNYGNADGSATCSTAIDFTSSAHLGTASNELADNNVSIVALLDGSNSINYIGFDNLGRPLTSAGKCTAGCQLTFKGEQNVSVCIATQGYIYVCQ
jgi:MSHA pilin protein MshC